MLNKNYSGSVSVEIKLRAGWPGFTSRREHRFHTGSGAQLSSNSLGTVGPFPRGKAAGSWS